MFQNRISFPVRWSGLVIALLGMTAGIAGAAAYIVFLPSQPRLHISEQQVDFGEVGAWTTVSRTLTLTNAGKADLVISGVTASCSCTEAKLEKSLLAPGEQTHLDISVVRNSVSTGWAEVMIASNDPHNPKSKITLLSRKPWEVTISPPTVTFQELERAKLPVTRKLFLKASPNSDGLHAVQDVKARSSSEHMEVRVLPQQGGLDWQIKLKILETTPSGSWRARIHFEDFSRLIDKVVEVSASIRSAYFFPVADFVFCPEQSQQWKNAEAILVLKHRAPGAIRVAKVELDGDIGQWLEAEALNRGTPDVTEIRLSPISQTRPEKEATGHICVHIVDQSGEVKEKFSVPAVVCANMPRP